MEGHLHTSLRIPYISIPSYTYRSPFDYLPTTCISLRFIICNKVSVYIVTRSAERYIQGRKKRGGGGEGGKIKWDLFCTHLLIKKL